MKTSEERIDELEQRVFKLEQELRVKRTTPIVTAPQRHRQKTPLPLKPQKNNNKYALKEAIVGKYIVGALASLLIFIGAISLVILLWDKITPQLKLTMLILVSIITTSIGYFRILKQKNHINSIILGTGSGLLFISILSSYIYFGYISSNLSFLLVSLWSLLFILSYKSTKAYFTTIIAYIGGYIATLLGLSLIIIPVQLNMILIFVTSISVALIISGSKCLSKKYQLINLTLSLLSYITVYFWILLKIGVSSVLKGHMYYMIFLSIVMYVIINIANFLMNTLVETCKEYKIVSLIANITLGVIVGSCLISILGDLGRYVFVILSLCQILLNELSFKNIRKLITIINSLFIALVIVQGTHSVVSSVIGIILLLIFLMILDKRKTSNDYEELLMVLISLSMYKLMESLNIHKVNLFAYLLSLVTLAFIIVKILIDKYRFKDKKNIVILKVIGYLFIIQTVILFVSESIYRINNGPGVTMIYTPPIIYTFLTIKIIGILKFGYFKDWSDKDFKWFDKNLDVIEDKSYILFFITTSLMYVVGLFILSTQLEGYNIILMLLSTIAIMVIQSMELFKIRHKSEFIGVFEGSKYLIYIWVLMISLLNFKMSSLSMSIAGLMIALASITFGFNKKMKGLRLYGLVVTLLMVFKVITIDIGGQNSITRVISLIIGGLICFVISIVYNKIDKTIDD